MLWLGLLQIAFSQARNLHECSEQSCLKRARTMNGDDDAFSAACFSEDVMAAFDAIELPSSLLYRLGKIFAG